MAVIFQWCPDYTATKGHISGEGMWDQVGAGSTGGPLIVSAGGRQALDLEDNDFVVKNVGGLSGLVVECRIMAVPGSDTKDFCLIRNAGGSTLIGLRHNGTTGKINVRSGGSNLATSSSVVSAGMYVALGVNLASATGTYDLQIQGVSEASSTAADTLGATGTANDVRWQGPTNNSNKYKLTDFVISNTATDVQGPLVVHAVLVDGDGGTSDWTPSATGVGHSTLVDDATPDENTTYLESNVNDEVEELTLAALPASGTIRAVSPFVVSTKPNSGSVQIAIDLVSPSVATSTGTALTLPDTSYGGNADVYVSSASGGTWNETLFNASRVSVRTII